jgi:hypothetical protein
MTFEGMAIEGRYPSFIQLLGLAIENVTKGAIVKLYGTKIPYEEYKTKVFSHLTSRLMKDYITKLQLSHKEKQILETMEEYVYWRGRYFVSKNVQIPKKYFGYNIGTIEKTIQDYIDFYERLKVAFNAETGWQMGSISPTGRISSDSVRLARF